MNKSQNQWEIENIVHIDSSYIVY